MLQCELQSQKLTASRVLRAVAQRLQHAPFRHCILQIHHCRLMRGRIHRNGVAARKVARVLYSACRCSDLLLKEPQHRLKPIRFAVKEPIGFTRLRFHVPFLPEQLRLHAYPIRETMQITRSVLRIRFFIEFPYCTLQIQLEVRNCADSGGNAFPRLLLQHSTTLLKCCMAGVDSKTKST